MIDEKSWKLGVIEGFFGRSWSWQDRLDYAIFLKEAHYQFYLYAPKSDKFLRKSWQTSWFREQTQQMIQLCTHYQNMGLQFGIGLSPYEGYLEDSKKVKLQIERKITELNTIGINLLAVLFDDMRGDIPNLAQKQAEIVHQIQDKSSAEILMCPTYYSTDPILEKVFGNMPKGYWSDLGTLLHPEIQICWTGPRVCSPAYPKVHLETMTQKFQRKPFLWDNYPANDGAKMSRFLHLRAFTQRSPQLSKQLSGHMVNPMNQPWLSRIPLASLPKLYDTERPYHPDQVFQQICQELCPIEIANLIAQDLSLFQDQGLDQFSAETRNELLQKYQNFPDNPYAQEIVDWLQEKYRFDPSCLTD